MNKYSTIQEASQAAIKLYIQSILEYKKRYKEDKRLPACPNKIYENDWEAFGKWYCYLGKEKPDLFKTIQEASQSAITLGIQSQSEYNKRYKEDPRLPASPNGFYQNDWEAFGSWYGYLGTEKSDLYKTIQEASQATINLGIQSQLKYKKRYKEDPRLPSAPSETYQKNWEPFGTWYGYLGKERPDFYKTIQEASQSAIKLGIQSILEYQNRYKEDPRLTASPDDFYQNDWENFDSWYGFLGKEKPDFYKTIQEASQAAIKLGIRSTPEYKNRYNEDPRLTSTPSGTYQNDWEAFGKWYGYLGNLKPDLYKTIQEASKAAINLGIQSHFEYNKRYKEDPRLPASPYGVYQNNWVNFGTWYGFLDIKKPFTRKDIGLRYEKWGKIYDSYIANIQAGLVHKRRTLIVFIAQFIMGNNLPESPEQFLLKTTRINIQQYESFLNYFGEKAKMTFHTIVLEFIDSCLVELCTLDDDHERNIHPGYRNPLNNFQSTLLEIKQNKLDESCKPVLAYTYVVAAREWIIPLTAKNFSDLTNIQGLVENDWFDVDLSLIDRNDPDCVYRYVKKDRREGKHTGKLIGAYNERVYQMWSPARFFALFTLLCVPARGQQILWCDSGEADKKVPEFVGGKIKWCSNTGSLAGLTKKQGFLKEYSENELGLHFTTNKTAFGEGGYDIPWTPENLPYWMIKLRKWQSKYNPITEPTKWTDLKLTNPIGSNKLEQRGRNCFLFRQHNDFNPHQQPIFGKALSYVLHQIERSDNPLTTKVNKYNSLNSYKSEYTPHAMRVSLITAFVVDAKVPIHIVQKLVGHARIVMTIYYTKIGIAEMRDELNKAEKRAMATAPARIQQQIRNKKFEEIRESLVPNDSLVFNKLHGNHPTSAFSFTDIGICPMGGGKCEQGGDVEKVNVKYKKYLPVVAGHLGEKNCIRCRFFITSPAFLGGLTAVFNEISLKQYGVKQKESDLLIHIEKLEDERYDCETSDNLFTKSIELEKAESNLEMVAKETSMYATDTVYLARLVSQCIALLNESIKNDSTTENMLVTNTASSSMGWSLEETNSEFHQLSTVCQNATIYALADASTANPRRSQLIDKMAKQNGMEPKMYLLSPEQQLAVGNQMSELLLSRFKSWGNVEKLMNADLFLDDLKDENQLTPLRDEVKNILLGNQNNLGFNKPILEEV
ncbi:VPA1269 family protein [Thalassotalea psychrophila]|uniref:VPA1269 family protein n=1 Tax=Thalassotalea psychrophila TaxID=3065647 RepID=A0ABY9TP80_9GAMM|nr:VPA1269 family protein [Colwelliaceae bacterium SQ149]